MHPRNSDWHPSLFIKTLCNANQRIITLLLFGLLIPISAHGHPILLNSNQLNDLFGLERQNLIAVKAEGTSAQRVALQIDEVEDESALVLREPFEIRKLRESLAHPRRNDPFQGYLQSVHRLVLDERDFSSCDDECQKKLPAQVKTICRSPTANVLTKVSLADSKKSIFIADCSQAMEAMPSRKIKYESSSKTLTTPKYEYVHLSDKNIFFKEIIAKNEKLPLLSKSELKVYLKPKYLFNMKFKDDDLVSQITSLSQGSQSLSLEVAVALNLLAMKINSQICCDVSFYEDALYFPVVLDLPFEGSSFAKGSGVFFGFQTDQSQNVKTEFIPSTTPDGSDAILIQQGKNLIALGFRSPNKKQQIPVRPKVVSKTDMEGLKFMPVQSPTGFFYDIKSAQKGFQHFMVWMFFGDESERAKLITLAQTGGRIQVERFTSPSAR